MPAVVGHLVAELRASTTKLRQDFAEAQAITRQGAKGMSLILDEHGEPAFKTFEAGAKRARDATINLGHEMRGSAHAVRALALPFASELSPALGTTVSRMTEVVTMSLRVSQGFTGIALAGASLAGVIGSQLVNAYMEAKKAQDDFARALRCGEVGQMDAQFKKVSERVRELSNDIRELDARAGESRGMAFLRGPRLTQQAGKEQERAAAFAQLGPLAIQTEAEKARIAEAQAMQQGEEQLRDIQQKAAQERLDQAKKDAEELAKLRLEAAQGSIQAQVAIAEQIVAGTEAAQLEEVRMLDAAAKEREAIDTQAQQQHIQGWTAAIDAQEQAEIDELRTMQQIERDRVAEAEKTQQAINASLVEGAEARIRATEEEQKAEVAIVEANIQARQAQIVAASERIVGIFTPVGDAIIDAFARGEEAAITFGNVARAIVASLARQILEIAFIRPAAQATAGFLASTLP